MRYLKNKSLVILLEQNKTKTIDIKASQKTSNILIIDIKSKIGIEII